MIKEVRIDSGVWNLNNYGISQRIIYLEDIEKEIQTEIKRLKQVPCTCCKKCFTK
jgi:hypothetical protein